MSDLSRLPGPVADVWDWQLHAACRGLPSDMFFHPDNERGPARAARDEAAKVVCAGCQVRVQCRAHALEVREPYGVWGGLSEDERDRQHLSGRWVRQRSAPSRNRRTAASQASG
jgi:WhiB family transcriptional regulator, redox-sensing transcriptional regulator